MIKITKLILLFVFSVTLTISAQVGYVSVEDEIYAFLDRMSTNGIIENYNSFELPKTRSTIKIYLTNVVENQYKLDHIDQQKLEDFLTEFEIDLNITDKKSITLFGEESLNYLFSEKEKYLFKYYNEDGTSFFINFIGKLDFLFNSDIENNLNSNSLLYRFGGEVRGTFFNRIGFEVNTTNGSFFGNKDLAREYSSLKYNYKFHQDDESNTGNDYFDESSAFFALDYEFATIKIGNDRKLIGHGTNKIFLSNHAPKMDYISLDLKYKLFNFSFFHAKLLGNQYVTYDSLQGAKNVVADKYLAYHRIGLNFSKHLQLGLGEMVIYSNRNIDLSYLNPFAFYKSAEHANQDRDNSFLFFDIQNNSFDGFKFYSTIILDDIDFGKFGTGWYGNKSLINVGTYISSLYKNLPLDLEIQYTKIDPYVFSHHINDNNYTNLDYNLGSELQPNSSSVAIIFFLRPHHRVNVNSGFSYTVHGANTVDGEGNLIKNFGGNILMGHRPFDSEEVYFLGGEKEYSRKYHFSTMIEPIKNWIVSIKFNFDNNSLSRSQHSEMFFTTLSLYSKF